MSTNRADRVPLAYIRLSKDELDDTKEPVEVKLEKRLQIAVGLAAQHDLDIAPSDMTLERQSAQTIEQRVEFPKVLERCRAGGVSHLITPYMDRILRGSKRDEADVEEALKLGKVILISTDGGVMDFGDPDFDSKHGLNFSIRNAVSRQYIFDLAKKQRETNKVRVKAGQHYCAVATYGYEWIKPIYQHRRLLEPGRYVAVETEYDLVCEFFRRVRYESINSVARDWNERFQRTGHPDPTKCPWRPAKAWYPKTLREMLLNPFYAGYPTHRWRNTNYGRSHERLAKEDWIMADEEQDYPHPVSLTELEELQQIVTERRNEGEAKPSCDTILSGGVLYCAADERMRGNQHDYSCRCGEYGKKHQTKAISKPRIHIVAQQLVRDCIDAMPDTLLQSAGADKSSKRDLKTQYEVLKKRLREEEAKTKDLMEYASMQIRIYGAEKYEQVCEENQRTVFSLQEQVSALEQQVGQPDISDIRPVLMQLKEFGFDEFWAAASNEVKRTLVPYFVRKLKLVAPGEGHKECKLVEVTLTDLALDYLPPDYLYRTESFPLNGRAGLGLGREMPLTKNGKRVHRKLPDL